MTSSRGTTADRWHPSPDGGGQVHLYNEEPRRRTVTVVIRGRSGPVDHGDGGRDDERDEDVSENGLYDAERVVLPAGGVVRLELPAVEGSLSVGCHATDGRSGVRTFGPGGSGPVVFSLRNGSILLDPA